MTNENIARPVSAAERIATLDVLRGFALLGILLANLMFFAQPVSDTFDFGATGNAADAAIGWVIAFFAQGKFYPLFSLLFGLGFAIQLERAYARGGSVVPVYMRRLLVLLAFGVLHGTFIWAGDILTVYAVLGFLLLLIGRGSPTRLLVVAMIAYTLQLLLMFGMSSFLEYAAANPEAAAPMMQDMQRAQAENAALGELAWAAYTNGTYMEVTAARFQEFTTIFSALPYFGLHVFAMFLFGAWLGRKGHFANPLAHKRFFLIALVVAVGVGVPLSAWYATTGLGLDNSDFTDPRNGWNGLVNFAAGPMLTLGYASAIALAMQTRAARWLGMLAPLGRMALTNYLLQSVVMTLVYYSYGFDMMERGMGAMFMISVALPLYVAQIVFSHWWLKRFAFGPMEWVWRTLTYFRRPAMRLETRPASSR